MPGKQMVDVFGIKIRSQIFYILYLPMALCVISLAYFNTNNFKENLQANARHTAYLNQLLADAQMTAALRMNGDKKELDALFSANGNLLLAEIRDSEGNALYRYHRDPEKRTGKTRFRNSGGQTGENAELYIKSYGGQTIYVTYLPDPPIETLHTFNIAMNVLLAGLFLLCCYIAVSAWSKNAVERPIERILSGHEQLGKGDFDIRMNTGKTYSNELTQTYASFNDMAMKLQHFKEELETKNESLADINQKYRQLNDQLEMEVQKKTKELREFFYLVTHDLKVPLAAAQGYTQLLTDPKTGELNEKQKQFLNSISMAHSHLLHLVRNMIDSVKHDGNKVSYFMEDFKISDLTEELKSNLLLFLEEKNLELRIRIENPEISIHADRIKISQVLSNLINNAITVSDNSSAIELDIRSDGKWAYIEVRDFGCGIPKEKMEKIFNKFTQYPYGTKGSGGMGLGLYIVSKTLEGHAQRIGVRSKEGEGTVFSFKLPLSADGGTEER